MKRHIRQDGGTTTLQQAEQKCREFFASSHSTQHLPAHFCHAQNVEVDYTDKDRLILANVVATCAFEMSSDDDSEPDSGSDIAASSDDGDEF